MKRTVLVRYGELSLKSEPVREKFERILINNIKSTLKQVSHKITQERGRIFLKTEKPTKVAERIAKLPGIVSTSPTWETEATMQKIRNSAKDIIEKKFPEKGTFAIRVRRVGEHPFSSKKIEEKVGSDALEIKPNLKVNLDSPENKLHIEVRKGKAYLFTRIIPGTGGLPVGSQEKVIVPFITDFESSATSTYLLLKRGALALPLFLKPNGENPAKYHKTVDKLRKFHPDLKSLTIKVNEILDKLNENVIKDFEGIVQQKILMKLIEKIADKLGAEGIVRSENLEKIAESKLQNLKIIKDGISMPFLNPLLGYEEKEIGENS